MAKINCKSYAIQYYNQFIGLFYCGVFCLFLNLVATQNLIAQKLTILASTTLFLGENAILTSTADLLLNGTLKSSMSILNLKGNWEGTGSADLIESTLNLLGEKDQTLDIDLKSVYILHINARGTKIFNHALVVENKLWLEKGLIKLPDSEDLKLNGTLEGGSLQSYVINSLVRKGTSQDVSILFPIGDATKYLPFQLTNLQVTEDFEMKLELIQESPDFQLDDTGLLENISTVRFWRKTQISPTNPILGNVSLTFNEDESPITVVNAVVLAGEMKGSTFENLGRTEDSTSTFINGQTSFKDSHHIFTLGGEKNFEDLDCIPNAFATSAEKEDDKVFKVMCPRISKDDFNISIFNTWGINVWNSNELDAITNTGWDGMSLDGKKLLPGVYEYLVKGKMTNGNDFIKQGIIFKLD